MAAPGHSAATARPGRAAIPSLAAARRAGAGPTRPVGRLRRAEPPTQLVVVGAKRWPDGVVGAAGRRVAGLLEDAVFVPHDAELAASGITASVTPAGLRQAVTPVLRRWGLLPEPTSTGKRLRRRERS